METLRVEGLRLVLILNGVEGDVAAFLRLPVFDAIGDDLQSLGRVGHGLYIRIPYGSYTDYIRVVHIP